MNSPWMEYHKAVLGIINLVKETLPLSELQRRRIAEAEAVVEAVSNILRLESEDADDAADDADAFISLQDGEDNDAAQKTG